MSEQKVLLYCNTSSAHSESIKASFVNFQVKDASDLVSELEDNSYQLCVIDMLSDTAEDVNDRIQSLIDPTKFATPILVLADDLGLSDKVNIYNLGVDDIVGGEVSSAELVARCRKAIYHKLAMEQLNSRLIEAKESAHVAMLYKSQLDSTIDFLMAIHDCDNLDQLGQQLFKHLEEHNLHCSIQMRSVMSIKNMEPTGMAKDLVSQLLSQLKNEGGFLDLGRRMIINHERVSLLVKNMPENDVTRYGVIKNKILAIVKGVNTRVLALESFYLLEQEKIVFDKFSGSVAIAVETLQNTYQRSLDGLLDHNNKIKQELRDKLKKLHISEIDKKEIHDLVVNHLDEIPSVIDGTRTILDICESLKKTIRNSMSCRQQIDAEELYANDKSQDSQINNGSKKTEKKMISNS